VRRNTLDLDFVDKETFVRIYAKILDYPNRIYGLRRRDTWKGIHLEFFCENNCDLCRLVFDDPVRYARDLRRPVFSRDVLFDCKELVRNGV